MSVFRFLRPSLQKVLKAGCSNMCIVRLLSYTPNVYAHAERDPAPVFFEAEIQTLLQNLTRADLQKVYKMRELGSRGLEQPTYKFMTSEELESLMKEAKERVSNLLQMPPVVKICQPINSVVSRDPALQGLNSCRYVFTDVTFGIKDSDRLVVVREPDGTLQHAEWELRLRMNQLYFPKEGRGIKIPRMFQDEYLESLLDRNEYEFILDRACAQFEPFDPMYQRVISLTYEHVNAKSAFNQLRSTRHFGPLVFYLVWFKNLDNLLLELIETLHIDEASFLLKLFSKVHNKLLNISDHTIIDAIKEYIAKDAQKKAVLELALQAYMEIEKQRQEYQKGLEVAHGLV